MKAVIAYFGNPGLPIYLSPFCSSFFGLIYDTDLLGKASIFLISFTDYFFDVVKFRISLPGGVVSGNPKVRFAPSFAYCSELYLCRLSFEAGSELICTTIGRVTCICPSLAELSFAYLLGVTSILPKAFELCSAVLLYTVYFCM